MTIHHTESDSDSLSFEIVVRYPLRLEFTRGLFRPENPLLGRLIPPDAEEGVLCVADAGLWEARPDLAGAVEAALDRLGRRRVGRVLLLPGGEKAKNDPTLLGRLYEAVAEGRLGRHSYVLAIGGGALLDLAGYAAATAHRGLRLVRVPSTTLAMADSGVGVKNAVNAVGRKNFAGTFAPPVAVVNDLELLDSLSARDLRGGLAEAIKVALIRDAGFFEWMEGAVDDLGALRSGALERAIRRSAELHLRHIAEGGDPFEFGSARPLDFGHWSAHKLEQLSGWRISHGEAVACGVALDCLYSVVATGLAAADADRVLAVLARLGFALWFPEMGRTGPDGRLELLKGIAEFREHLGGPLCVPMLGGIGRLVEVNRIDPDRMAACLARLAGRAAASGGVVAGVAVGTDSA